MSVVSLQELLVATQMQRDPTTWRTWIARWVRVIGLTEPCVEHAARLQLAVARDPWETKAKRREITSIWCRDAAITGTAAALGFDAIVTTDKQFRKYQPHFPGEIIVVEPEGSPLASR